MPCVVEQRHFQSIMLERMERLQIKMREGFERILRGGQASGDITRDDERLENNCGSDSDGRMLRVQIQPIRPSQQFILPLQGYSLPIKCEAKHLLDDWG